MTETPFSERNAGRPRNPTDFDRVFPIRTLTSVESSPHRSHWRAGRALLRTGVAMMGTVLVMLTVAAVKYEAILAMDLTGRLLLAAGALIIGIPSMTVALGAMAHQATVLVDTKAREIHYRFRFGEDKHVVVRCDEMEVLAVRQVLAPNVREDMTPVHWEILCAEMRGGALVSLAVNPPEEFVAEVEKAFEAGPR